MRRIRQLVLALMTAAVLLVPLAGAASAAPGNGGGPGRTTIMTAAASLDPGDGGGY